MSRIGCEEDQTGLVVGEDDGRGDADGIAVMSHVTCGDDKVRLWCKYYLNYPGLRPQYWDTDPRRWIYKINVSRETISIVRVGGEKHPIFERLVQGRLKRVSAKSACCFALDRGWHNIHRPVALEMTNMLESSREMGISSVNSASFPQGGHSLQDITTMRADPLYIPLTD